MADPSPAQGSPTSADQGEDEGAEPGWGPSPVPRWWRVFVAVPVLAAAAAAAVTGGEDLLAVVVTFWVSRSAVVLAMREVLVRRGHHEKAAKHWLERWADTRWFVPAYVAFAVWVCFHVATTLKADPQDWATWIFAAGLGLIAVFGGVMAGGDVLAWIRGRRRSRRERRRTRQ